MEKNRGGRPCSTNYKELNFEMKKCDDKKKIFAVCNICKKILQNTALQRLKAHRNCCKSETDSRDAEVEQLEIEEELVFMDENDNEIQEFQLIQFERPELISTCLPVNTINSKHKKRSRHAHDTPPRDRKIVDFLDKINEKQISEITEAMAKFFFACNISFNVIESKFFSEFIRLMRPSFAQKIPSRKSLALKLLDSVYAEHKAKSLASVKKNSVLLIEGWKNSSYNTKTVVCILHDCTSDNKVFINAWNLNGISETGDKLAEIVYEAIDLAKNEYNTDVFAVVSDNASNMVRMGKNLKHVVWHTTCNSHIGNLLAKDMVDYDLVKKATMILKHFKQPDFEHAILKKGGSKIKLPCETRWGTYRDCFKCLTSNIKFMKITAAECSEKITKDVMKLLFDDTFLESVKNSIAAFDPICELINQCQKPKTSIADAVNLWLNLKIPSNFKKYYEPRLEMSSNVYSLVAYYLHPFFNNDIFSKANLMQIHGFLFKNLNSDGLDEWDKYKEKEGIFLELYEKSLNNPISFWKTAEFYAPSLSKLAIKLLKIPASSAEIERTFSKWSLIHTPIRNRLSFDRSKKLMYLYMSLRMEDNVKILDDDYLFEEDEDKEKQ